MPLQLLLGLPLGSSFSVRFFYSRAKRRERKRRNFDFLRPEIFRGPHARAWQRVLSAPSDLYVPRWKTWDELEMKESLSKHMLVCFLFLFSLLMVVKSDILADASWFKNWRGTGIDDSWLLILLRKRQRDIIS